MKRFKLEQETFYLATRVEMENCGLDQREYLIVGITTGLAITPVPNKEQIFALLGHDVRKIDTALSADWVDQMLRRDPKFDITQWGWSYEGTGNSLGTAVKWDHWELEGALLRILLGETTMEVS